MILDASFPPDPRVENEAVSLINKEHEVHLFCLDYEQKMPKSEVINGIHVYRISPPKYVYKFSALAYTVPYYHYRLKKYIKTFVEEKNIQAIHIHDIQIARSIFKLNLAIPVVLDLHENRPEIMKFYTHVNTTKGKLLIQPKTWKKFEYKYIQEADHVIVVTDEAKDYYLKEIKVEASKFRVVPNTVRKAFYKESEIDNAIVERYKDNFVLLYVGDTGVRRGIETILLAMKQLIPKIPSIKLVVVGENPADSEWKKIVKENGIEGHVDLEGWQSFKLFPSYIKAAAIGVCPIHKNIHHETTFANKIFQYLAFGNPIVVSDCKAQQNVVEKYECGIVFKDRDITDYVNAILALYNSKELYNKQSVNAQIAIDKHLNWGVVSQDLISLYEELNKR